MELKKLPNKTNTNRKTIKPKPRYYEVADQIRLQILMEHYTVGKLLPSESDLQIEFKVSRHTIREAIRLIRLDGIVSPEHGRGVRVTSIKSAPWLNVIFNSLEGIERHGRVTRLVDLKVNISKATDALAQDLRCKVGDELLHLKSFREPRDLAMELGRAWNETYLLGRFSSIRNEISTWPGALYSLIEQRYGERIVYIQQNISALNMGAKLAKRLQVKVGTAGIEIKRTYINANGTPLLIGFNTYVGKKFIFSMEIKAKNSG